MALCGHILERDPHRAAAHSQQQRRDGIAGSRTGGIRVRTLRDRIGEGEISSRGAGFRVVDAQQPRLEAEPKSVRCADQAVLDRQQVAFKRRSTRISLSGRAKTIVVRRRDAREDQVIGICRNVAGEAKLGRIEAQAERTVIELDAHKPIAHFHQIRRADRARVIDGHAVVQLRLVIGTALPGRDAGREQHRRRLVQIKPRKPDKEPAAVAQVLIDLRIQDVRVENGRPRSEIVVGPGVGGARPVGQRKICRNVLPNLIDAVRRNDISWKRSSLQIALSVGKDI